jgi:hypothetical protein
MTLLMDPATIGWLLFVWFIYSARRLGRASGRKEIASTEAMGQGGQWGGPKALIVVIFLLILMFVVAWAAGQVDRGAPSTQSAVAGTAAAQPSGTFVIAIAVAIRSSLYFALNAPASLAS